MKRRITFKNDGYTGKIIGSARLLFGIVFLGYGFAAHSQTYCEPFLDCTDNDLILNVSLSTLTNASTCGADGYTDYTALPAPTLVAGTSYPISVTVGNGWSNESVSTWIDYNGNGTFEASEFTYIGTGSGSVVTGSILIPPTATAGNKRLRVRVAAVGAVGATADLACDEIDEYGETEDYTVNIQAIAGTDDFARNPLTVYKADKTFVIESPNSLITGAHVYDLTGKLVYSTQDVGRNALSIDGTAFSSQVLLLNVTTDDGASTTRKLVN